MLQNLRIKNTSAFSAIKLDENVVPREVQILRVGKFNHPSYGYFEITPLVLTEMKANFDNRVRGIDMAFDYYHASDEDASAWVEELMLKEKNTELWARVKWTPKAERKLAERELRYFSPDFAFKWTDPETGVEFKNVLFGGGLTNRPFVKEMTAIVADEIKEGIKMTELEKAQAALKESEAKVIKLSEDMKDMEKKMADMPAPDKVAQLEAQIKAMQAELEKAKAEKEMMTNENKEYKEKAMLAEKENEFNVLLSEGKACAAQKEAFVKGDMKEFIKLAQPLNLKGNGTSQNPQGGGDEIEKTLKLAEEKMKADSKLSKADAISLARKELKK